MTHETPRTCDLVEDEADRELRERRNAAEATEPAEELTAQRRADKAAYLTEKLRERRDAEG
jgi:hypothetical protein